MSTPVANGAMLMCSMGMAPGTLMVMPNFTEAESQNLATVMDFIPMTNISSFGMCQSPANPQVAAATAAAMGVLTPQPCVPATVAPWTPGAPLVTVGMAGYPCLTSDSKCMCTWAGVIEITFSAVMMTTVGG